MGAYISLLFRVNPLPSDARLRECVCVRREAEGTLHVREVTSEDADDPKTLLFKPLSSYWARYPPHVWRTVAASALIFGGLNVAIPWILPRAVTDALSDKARRQLPVYLTSLLHHLIVAPWSIVALIRDARAHSRAGADTYVDHDGHMLLAGVSGGYFIADFIATLPDAMSSPDYALHHLIALAVIFGGLSYRAARWIPHILVSESSTIFLDILWLLRAYNRMDSPAYAVSALAFLSLYTLTRIVHLPLALLAIYQVHTREVLSLGLSRHCLLVAQALQFWWFAKIIKQFAPALRMALTVALHTLRRTARTQLAGLMGGDR